MDKEFIDELIFRLESNVKDMGDFILRKKLTNKALRYALGIPYKEVVKISELDKKTIDESLAAAQESGLIEIKDFIKKNTFGDNAMIQLSDKKYSSLKSQRKFIDESKDKKIGREK